MTFSRRNIFKTIAGAACAAAIELNAVVPRMPFVKKKVCPDDIIYIQRNFGRVSALMSKESLPSGMGYTWRTEPSQSSLQNT